MYSVVIQQFVDKGRDIGDWDVGISIDVGADGSFATIQQQVDEASRIGDADLPIAVHVTKQEHHATGVTECDFGAWCEREYDVL